MEIPAALVLFMTGLKIEDPMIELLAIKLYEHDTEYWPRLSMRGWLRLPEADRETYRALARSGNQLR